MEVLKNLNESEVTALRERFAEPLTEEEFEEVLTEFSARMPHIDIARLRLHELFNDIDANGDSTVSWDEFTMYLIDTAALEATLATSGRDAVIKQYRPINALDNEVPGSIAHMHFLRDINRVVKVIQRDKYSKIRLCHPTPTLPMWMEVPRSDSAVLAFEYIPAKPNINVSNVLVVSTNDNVVRYHDVSRHQLSTSTVIKCRRQMPVPESQTALLWDAEHSKLIMGSRSGVISIINPDDPVPLNNERLHSSVVTSLLASNGTLYTASLDSTIKLVDLNRGIVRHTIDGPTSHQQGVFKLAMSEAAQQLYSVGLEPYVLVHSLSNTKMKPQKLLDKNRPHHGRIVALHVLHDSPQAITGDTSGLVKVWDTRTLSCVQTISTVKDDVFNVAATGGANLSSVGYIEKNRMLCINGRTTKIFGYDTASNPHLSDDTACTLVLFNPLSRTFMTVHRTTIKLWDGQTGALRGVHTNITSSDMTAITLAVPRMRKIIVGTLSGEVHAFGYAMCSPIGDGFPKAYSTPTASVVALWYLDGFKENRNQYILTVFKREVVLVPDAEDVTARSLITLHCFQEPLRRHQAKALSVTENKTVLLATEASTVYVCDLGTLSLSCVVRPQDLRGDIACMTAFPDTITPFLAEGRSAAGHADLGDSFAVGPGTGGPFTTPGMASITDTPGVRRRNSQQSTTGGLMPGAASPVMSSFESPSFNRQNQPFYRRLGTGVAFVADSVGQISAVLMHSAQAMETIVTWRNLNMMKRRHRRRHRHRNAPNANAALNESHKVKEDKTAIAKPGPGTHPQVARMMAVAAAREESGDVIDMTLDGSVLLQPAQSLAVGDVVNMIEDEVSSNPDSPMRSPRRAGKKGAADAEQPPLGEEPPAAAGEADADDAASDDEHSGSDSSSASSEEAQQDEKKDGSVSGGDSPQKQQSKKKSRRRKNREDRPRRKRITHQFSDADVPTLLGSRPNSAVAAYFSPPRQRALDSGGDGSDVARAALRSKGGEQGKVRGRARVEVTAEELQERANEDAFTAVVTAMCFIADGHILVTGDENGYVTAWDVDLIVRKAARHAANRDAGDVAAETLPTPVASWRAHADEVVSVAEAFGEWGDTRVGTTGAVIATASIDRNIVLWTTDGVSLGNLAQGRIADVPMEELPEGIQPYLLDDPPAHGWSVTDKVRKQRDVVGALADATRDARMAFAAKVGNQGSMLSNSSSQAAPGPTSAKLLSPTGGFGGSGSEDEGREGGRKTIGTILTEKVSGMRSRRKSAQPPPAGEDGSPLGTGAANQPAALPSPPALPAAAKEADAGFDTGSTAPLAGSATVGGPTSLTLSGNANDDEIAGPFGAPARRAGESAGTSDGGTSFFVTEVDVTAPPPDVTPQDQLLPRGGDDLTTSEDDEDQGVPRELRGLIAPDRFKLPLIPPRRLGGQALRDSAGRKNPSLDRVVPRLNQARIRREAEVDAAQTARTYAQTAPAAPSRQPVARTARGTRIPQPPGAGGSGFGKHLSGATQKYLHRLGFDDNPQENPEQKSLRHTGGVVLRRPGATMDATPSRRIL